MSLTYKPVKSAFSNGKLVGFRVDGTGTASISGTDSNLCTLTDNGTGDYSLTFTTELAQPPIVVSCISTEGVVISQQTNPTTTVVRLLSYSLPTAEKTAVLSLNGIKFHSLLQGADGNDITIQITPGATAGSEVVTSTSAGAITIQVETGVSTATQVYAAMKAAFATSGIDAFVGYELITGATAWSTAAAANLAGGVTGVASAATDADFDVLMFIDQA